MAERRFTVRKLIEFEYEKLKESGYNPIEKVLSVKLEYASEIDPNTHFIEGLRLAMEKLSVVKETRDDIKYIINGIQKAATQLQISTLPISKIGRKHIKMALEQCEKINKKWSANRYNVYRAYLLMLFKELVELEVVQVNPIKDISKMKTLKRLKPVLSNNQREIINSHIRAKDYRFWLFVNLFFHSGERIIELMQIKSRDVNLTDQYYITMIRKGSEHREVRRTIKSIAIPFWAEFLRNCGKDQFLFGIDFTPAGRPMVPDTITRR